MTTRKRDWYLIEWAEVLGKRQAGLVNDLGWLKGRASKFWNGQHPYRRDIVNEIADWLEIEPYELLMPPEEALALRRLREHAAIIASDDRSRTTIPPIGDKAATSTGPSPARKSA